MVEAVKQEARPFSKDEQGQRSQSTTRRKVKGSSCSTKEERGEWRLQKSQMMTLQQPARVALSQSPSGPDLIWSQGFMASPLPRTWRTSAGNWPSIIITYPPVACTSVRATCMHVSEEPASTFSNVLGQRPLRLVGERERQQG